MFVDLLSPKSGAAWEDERPSVAMDRDEIGGGAPWTGPREALPLGRERRIVSRKPSSATATSATAGYDVDMTLRKAGRCHGDRPREAGSFC
jgi:hypothetical protein